MRILISGTSSGLGRHLHELMGGRAVTRADDISMIESETKTPYDVIIHCAVNSAKEIRTETVTRYVDDNLGLTRRLTEIPHHLFVYVSTVDVYPSDGGPYDETFEIAGEALLGVYRVTKFSSEAYVRQYCVRHLIIRPTTLVGRYARSMTLTRLAQNPKATLFLSADSLYNIISHNRIAAFIQAAIRGDVTGIFNLASSGYLRLGDIATWLGAQPTYGSYLYKVAKVSNAKARSILPDLAENSGQVFLQHLSETVDFNHELLMTLSDGPPVIDP